ncbi:hypothetical protein [Rhizobium sp. RU36D]|uniref:hypothetical protein n=1 Tax=Rhizobium sp. RU36D TaxID=1907415 RepID=UPI0009D8156A|nr:hypothetical protein [Rhizobium sp. RU36D]SMD14528.1 hypothetical protein SAMN05880593_12638 [Rhizobium sp. RU36D]
MSSHSELPRFLVLALALGGAASCSSSGRMPPEPIGYAGPARPPRHEMVREGRVEDPPSNQYAEDLLQVPESSASYGYADTGMAPPIQNAYGAEPQSAPLDAIAEASAEPLYTPEASQTTVSGDVSDINSEGINIDAELGVAGAAAADPLLVPPQADGPPPIDGIPLKRRQPPQQQVLTPPPPGSHLTIAEDNPSQVVVDGIGTDAPVVVQN